MSLFAADCCPAYKKVCSRPLALFSMNIYYVTARCPAWILMQPQLSSMSLYVATSCPAWVSAGPPAVQHESLRSQKISSMNLHVANSCSATSCLAWGSTRPSAWYQEQCLELLLSAAEKDHLRTQQSTPSWSELQGSWPGGGGGLLAYGVKTQQCMSSSLRLHFFLQHWSLSPILLLSA